MIVIRQEIIKRSDLRNNPRVAYLFGDNLERRILFFGFNANRYGEQLFATRTTNRLACSLIRHAQLPSTAGAFNH